MKKDFVIQVSDGNIGVYWSIFGVKSDLIVELKDVRIKKSELDTIVAAGNTEGNMRIRGVGGMPTQNDSEFCIEIESSPTKCNHQRTGDKIHLSQNNIVKAVIPKEFETFRFCLPFNYVDIVNDEFKMEIQGNNDVSYTILVKY